MQIPEEKRVRTYELTYLVSQDFSKEQLEKVKDRVSKIIEKTGSKIEEVVEWGKKEMAYTIKKDGVRHNFANYFHLVFEAEAKEIASIRGELDIEEEIIRYLLVVRD